MEDIIPNYIRAVKTMHVMSEWMKAVTADDPAPREGGRNYRKRRMRRLLLLPLPLPRKR